MKKRIKTMIILSAFALFSSTITFAQKNKHHNKKENYNDNNYNYNNDTYNKDRYDNKYNNRSNYNNQDLVGRSAINAYSALRNRNFYEQKTHQQGGNTYKVWYNRNTRQCIKTTSRDRRITSIVSSTHCR
jgi:flagellar biosynthesis GTPase FlhF